MLSSHGVHLYSGGRSVCFSFHSGITALRREVTGG